VGALNLLPREYQQAQRRIRRVRAWAAVLLPAAGIVAALLAVDGVQDVRAEELRLENDRIQEQLNDRRSEVRRLAAAADEALVRLQRSDALRAKRNWSGMFQLFAECMPAACWLESVATDPDMPPASGGLVSPARPAGADSAKTANIAIEAPRKVRLRGYALDAAEPLGFVAKLKQSGVFQSVTMERSVYESEGKPPRFRFELICEW